MRKILLLLLFFVSFICKITAQNLSYTCPRNITVSCGPACMTINAKFPDLRSLSDDYTVSNITSTAVCYPPANPGAPGSPTSITQDDTYSSSIGIGFNFPFYGTPNSSLLVSTNGYLCFDLTKAGMFSHYGILNSGGGLSALSGTPQDIPSSLYDKSLIMGAYHDLDPSVTTSPTRQIKYDIIGSAPTRKFVVSFFKEPLFYSSCNNLILNTQEIILHESSGVIEVFVQDKQICGGWNNGLAMIGIQDATRAKGLTAPGRAATSGQWGTVGMNESWRFIPKNGAPLYRGVQLLNAAGTVVAVGDTSRLNANTFEWNFPNICPTPNVPTLYVVKTTYQRIDNAAATFYSLDTITVLRQNALAATVTSTPTTCGASVGTITATPTSGTGPFTYTLNGGAPVSAPGAYTFTGLAAGTYTIAITDVSGCTNTFTSTVNTTSTITATYTTTPTSCPLSVDGTITVTPTSGTAPYTYSLDGGSAQTSNVFTNVASGPHTILFTDAAGCTGTINVTITAGTTPLTANINTTATSCPTASNGTITVTVTSGSPAYQYSLDGGPYQGSNIFTNVAAGVHTITVKDLYGCTGTFTANVAQGASLTSTLSVINPPCSNLNNGSITITPTSGTAPYQYTLNGGSPQASNIFSGLAPGVYNISFTDASGCTGTNSTTLTTNPPITATSTLVKPLCHGNANGSITINAAGGVPPYQYSINGGVTYQASATFTGLLAGPYLFLVKDAQGCIFNFSFTLTEPTTLTGNASTIAATCNGNDGTITITAGGGTSPYLYSLDNGATYQPSNIFTVSSGVFPNILIKDANNCLANASTIVGLIDTMRLELGPDTTICIGQSVTFAPQTNALTNIFKWTALPALLITEIDKDSIANATVTPPFTKKYYLTAQWGVCQRKDSIIVNIMKKPVPFAGNDTTICSNTVAFLNGTSSNLSGLVYYTWSPIIPTLVFVSPDSSSATVMPDSTQEFYLNVKDRYGCNFSVYDTMKVFIAPPVPAFAGNDSNAVKGVPHQLMASGGTSYLWSPTSSLNNPFIQNPLATLYTDTYFRVLVTDAFGCSATDDVFIKVYEGPNYYVPNAFSPNGDGLNDIFRAIPVGISVTEYFNVYNRLGELVFNTNQWLKGWDGKYKGKDALAGSYVWTIKGIDRNNKVVEMRGSILLIR